MQNRLAVWRPSMQVTSEMEERLGAKQIPAALDAHTRIAPVSLDDTFKESLLHKLDNSHKQRPAQANGGLWGFRIRKDLTSEHS